MIIGSHVSFGKEQLLGSVKEAISYGSNTFMFYTGAPQNTRRSEIDKSLTIEAKKLMIDNNINIDNVVCHAPYIINLANNKDEEKYKFSIDFLIKEIQRCETLGIKKIVLHPGSSVGIDNNIAINNIVYALNIVLSKSSNVIILLETMAGKGSEIGSSLEDMQKIIEKVTKQELIGVCLDTCHLNDSGIDLTKFNKYLEEFDEKIGIKKIGAIHINDSKNIMNSHKDRHEIIGFGTIGFETILNIVNDKRFINIPKILETPYIGLTDDDTNRIYPPYKFEIKMLKSGIFNPNLKTNIREFYQK